MINLLELYGKYYVNSFSEETNKLSNLNNDKVIEILNLNWGNQVDKRRLRANKNKVSVIYHKVKSFSSKRDRNTNEVEGFYEVIVSSKIKKYFTSFKATLDYLLKEKLNPTWRCYNE